MSSRPLVGLTTTLLPRGGEHRRPQVVLYSSYIDVLENVGLAPVLLTPAHSRESLRAVLEHCGGLVLSGGEDVDPALYEEQPIPELGPVNTARDQAEFEALDLAIELGLPVLGICRGCQVLNVFLGGTLYQDIDAQRPGALRHRQKEWELRTHHARLEPDSLLVKAVGTAQLHINSFHHQAVKDPAPPLRVVATSEDGLIEAVEHRDLPWVVGVQWHPERQEATSPDIDPDRRLFAAFALAVAQRAGMR